MYKKSNRPNYQKCSLENQVRTVKNGTILPSTDLKTASQSLKKVLLLLSSRWRFVILKLNQWITLGYETLMESWWYIFFYPIENNWRSYFACLWKSVCLVWAGCIWRLQSQTDYVGLMAYVTALMIREYRRKCRRWEMPQDEIMRKQIMCVKLIKILKCICLCNIGHPESGR